MEFSVLMQNTTTKKLINNIQFLVGSVRRLCRLSLQEIGIRLIISANVKTWSLTLVD